MVDLATDAMSRALVVVAIAQDGQPQLCITNERKFADGGFPVAAAKAGWQVCNLATKTNNYC